MVVVAGTVVVVVLGAVVVVVTVDAVAAVVLGVVIGAAVVEAAVPDEQAAATRAIATRPAPLVNARRLRLNPSPIETITVSVRGSAWMCSANAVRIGAESPLGRTHEHVVGDDEAAWTQPIDELFVVLGV